MSGNKISESHLPPTKPQLSDLIIKAHADEVTDSQMSDEKQPRIYPTYYVKHPDYSYSAAVPQPIPATMLQALQSSEHPVNAQDKAWNAALEKAASCDNFGKIFLYGSMTVSKKILSLKRESSE